MSYIWYVEKTVDANTRAELRQQMFLLADELWDREVVERVTELVRVATLPPPLFPINDPLVTKLWQRKLLEGPGPKGDEAIPDADLQEAFFGYGRREKP